MATLKELRKAKGWSQMELAVRAGVSMQAISRYETGRVQPIKAVRAALASALRVKPEEIVFRHEGD